MSDRPHDGFRHEAYLFNDADEFLADTVPFILDGVRARQPVMVVVTPQRLTPLRKALGREAQRVCLLDMQQLGGNPARIIPAWRAFVDEQPVGTPVRGVGEPIWRGRRTAELVECQLHEALLNVAISPETPLWLRCPYDASALEPGVLEEAHHSHPMMVDGEHYRGSTVYGGCAHVDDLMSRELPPPAGQVEIRSFCEEDLRLVRNAVGRWAQEALLSADRRDELVLVMHEIATNSIFHGGGSGTLRLWRDPDALVAEICDSGHLENALAGRQLGDETEEGGRGLWLAQQLADLVQIRRSPAGMTVRVHTWLNEQNWQN